MYNTLRTVYLYEECKHNISKKGVCLEDFANYKLKTTQTNKELYTLRRLGFLRVTSIEYPRGMKRFYHVITPLGKQKLNEKFDMCIPLTLRDRLFLKKTKNVRI